MLLAIDVGNTSTHFGLFRGRRLLRHFRCPTAGLDRTPACLKYLKTISKPSGVVVASVVPASLAGLNRAVRRLFGNRPLIVDARLKLPIRIKIRNPRRVGADRIVNAAAAFTLYGGPSIVIDFGTATTFDCVNRRGDFIGGAIAPGLKTAADALARSGAQLPRVAGHPPRRAVGRDTREAMESGIFLGYAGLTEGLITRLENEMGPVPRHNIVATGGLSPLIAKHVKQIGRVDPLLTLKGLQLIWELNQ